jgi:hypothetical protein
MLGISSQRRCPACGKTFEANYRDGFCTCGVELVFADPQASLAPTEVAPAWLLAQERPAPGTRCLVLYGPDRKPLHYFPLGQKDVSVIGRQDALAGHFPDIDLGAWLDTVSARRISRAHALVLHSRANDSFALRPLPGNTGTQIEASMVAAQQDYPLRAGTRLILGGAVRFKFEIA